MGDIGAVGSSVAPAYTAVTANGKPAVLLSINRQPDSNTVEVANLNSPGQLVVSGARDAIDRVSETARARGARRILPLNVGGPFHSVYMRPAAETLAHLQRPLRRLADLSQRGEYPLGSDEREALSAFVKSPYKSFLSKSTGEYLARILESMKKAIDSGKMEFKPKKTGRVSVQLNQLIGTTHLAEKQEKGRRLLARRRELLRIAECKDMYDRRKGLLSKIEETRREELELQEKMKSAASMTDAVNKRLVELLKQAEMKTREYVGKEVELEGISL